MAKDESEMDLAQWYMAKGAMDDVQSPIVNHRDKIPQTEHKLRRSMLFWQYTFFFAVEQSRCVTLAVHPLILKMFILFIQPPRRHIVPSTRLLMWHHKIHRDPSTHPLQVCSRM